MELLSTELLTVIISILSLLTSVAIAFILHSASKKIETQNFSNSLRGSWIDIDSTVLSDDKLLVEIDDLLHPGHKIKSLEGLTQHQEFMEIVHYSYEKDFRDLCLRVRDQYESERLRSAE